MVLVLPFFAGCSVPAYESANTQANGLQKGSVIDAVNVLLTRQDCSNAIAQIEPLYNSVNTDNSVRMAAAAAYGCSARVTLLTLLAGLLSFPGSLAGSGFFEFLASQFPSTSTPDDKVPTAAGYAIDALMSTVRTGLIFAPSLTVNSTTNNPGSLVISDRLDDANSYLTFVSMAMMGAIENRDGLPDSNYQKTTPLPGETTAATPGDACAYASALLNFYDGLSFIISASPPNVAALYGTIQTFLTSGLNSACELGCTTICGGAVTCTTCPTTLRSRTSCAGTSTDVNSCAAAGLMTFVNASWL